jgi:hypothetical protein
LKVLSTSPGKPEAFPGGGTFERVVYMVDVGFFAVRRRTADGGVLAVQKKDLMVFLVFFYVFILC